MKKNKTKNKILAITVMSVILCAMFCITAFAWDNSWTVNPFVAPSTEPSGYTLITITDGTAVGSSSVSASIYARINGSYMYCTGLQTRTVSGLSVIVNGDDETFIDTSSFVVYNGGCFYVENSKVSDVLTYLDSVGLSAHAPDPFQDIFDDISIGVSGSMSSVGTVASALTSNVLLTIMCIALPIVSIGVGFFVRLKNKA